MELWKDKPVLQQLKIMRWHFLIYQANNFLTVNLSIAINVKLDLSLCINFLNFKLFNRSFETYKFSCSFFLLIYIYFFNTNIDGWDINPQPECTFPGSSPGRKKKLATVLSSVPLLGDLFHVNIILHFYKENKLKKKTYHFAFSLRYPPIIILKIK